MNYATQEAIIVFLVAFLKIVTAGWFFLKAIKRELIPIGEFLALTITMLLVVSSVREAANAEELKNEKLVSIALGTLLAADTLYTISLFAYLFSSIKANKEEKK